MFWRRWASLVTSNGKDGLQLTAIWERMSTNEHLHHQTAQTPDISLFGVSGLSDDFGRHPVDTALQRWTVQMAASTATGTGPENGGSLDALGDTEIGNLDTTFVVHKNVCTLDITMDNVLAMEV